ncbi:helix-turn-helix domain-containing protein [Actinomadura sp. 3N407]|uniref:helix-turn-helix domain-containing protein n=1 Tax=Actinomadura sp. 3N407 TaxID=3457423 RepID=UPI003FCEA937
MVQRTFGESLGQLMEERGVSLQSLAAAVPCNAGYLSRVRNGLRTPRETIAERLDDLLNAGGTLVALLPRPPRPLAAMSVERCMEYMTPARMDAVLTHLGELWHALVRTDNLLGPRHALDGVNLQLGILTPLLAAARPSQRERVLRLAARYAESAAWLHEDAGNLSRSRRWTSQAMDWAVEAGDRHMVAWVLFRRSQQADAAAEMLGLAEAARREQRDEPSLMLAAILQQTAHGHALDSDETACHAALEQARTFAATDDAADAAAGHGAFCTPAYLDMQRGRCLSRLGRPDRAIPALAAALSGLPVAYQRDRGVAHAELAAAYLADDQPEPAAVAAGEALTIAQGSGSARIGGMVTTVAAGLRPHRHLDPVTELLAELEQA